MKVILSTPIAKPPAWLTEKYPEALNCEADIFYSEGDALGFPGISQNRDTGSRRR